jgi:hypothetical protein
MGMNVFGVRSSGSSLRSRAWKSMEEWNGIYGGELQRSSIKR